ncbi:hypothetical protein FKM82_014500 [Ascaphus truei]
MRSEARFLGDNLLLFRRRVPQPSPAVRNTWVSLPEITMNCCTSGQCEAMSQPEVESFIFGCELSWKTKSYTFKVDEEDECEHCLSLHTISLGEGVKDECNIVEVIARNHNDEEIAVPVANLKLSCQPMVNMDCFELQPPVTFRLKTGVGPVHIAGRHIIGKTGVGKVVCSKIMQCFQNK